MSCALTQPAALSLSADRAPFSRHVGAGTTEYITAKSSCLVLEAREEHFYELIKILPKLHAELSLRAFGRKAVRYCAARSHLTQ